MKPRRVGIFPEAQQRPRTALLSALEEILPVRFEGREVGDVTGLDAAILLPGADPEMPAQVPCLVALRNEGPAGPLPPLGGRPGTVGPWLQLTDHADLDRRLRRATLRDATVDGVPPVEPGDRDVVLATRREGPLWVRRETAHGARATVAVAPSELEPGESLRDRVRDGRFLALVSLLHFLREVCGDAAWRPSGTFACFLFDDPNLHWTSYGYVRYPDLVREADRHGYHVAFAMVPFDGWFAHPAAANLFRTRPDRISLVVHGNNHDRLELARAATLPAVQGMLAQARQRVAAFERRSGVGVSRIMVAPHGVCSRDVARSLVPIGFEALSISRPYPWLARPPQPWLTRPQDSSPLAGWYPAAMIENGLPLLLRRGIDDPVEDLALRAFLDQPLIIQAHHQDVRGGLDQLAEVAGVIERLGDVRWGSLGEITKSNVMTRDEGDVLRVRMFSRRAEVAVPEGVSRIAIELPRLDAVPVRDAIVCSASTADGRAQTGVITAGSSERELPLPQGCRVVNLELRTDEVPAVAPEDMPNWPLRSLTRRFASEARDRLAPQSRRIRLRVTGGRR